MTASTFTELELDESLIDALSDKGYQRPTAIQAAAIPAAMDGRDVLGSARQEQVKPQRFYCCDPTFA